MEQNFKYTNGFWFKLYIFDLEISSFYYYLWIFKFTYSFQEIMPNFAINGKQNIKQSKFGSD